MKNNKEFGWNQPELRVVIYLILGSLFAIVLSLIFKVALFNGR